MLDINEIQNTIKQLEDGDTTFDACIKLASLYIVADRLNVSDEVESELSDILPAYQIYKEVKRRYQMNDTTFDKVLSSLAILSQEIDEFIDTLYTGTDDVKERHIIEETLSKLSRNYVENP